MSDLFLGQTCTAAFKFISAGTAHTFDLPFDADKVTFYNLTQWTATAGKLPISVWFKGQTTAAHAFQEQVIDSSAGASFNFLDTATNGFTEVDTPAGVTSFKKLISAVSQASPCVVTTSTVNGYQTDQIVRITDLGDDMPTARGMSELDGNRYKIVVLTTTTFSLYDVISGDPIDSTSFEAYVTGGRVNIETRVITINNPEISPYEITPYIPNPVKYNPETFQLTVGTAVMGANSDVFLMEVIKYGQVTDLGDLLT